MKLEEFLARLPVYRHIKNEMNKRSQIAQATKTLLKVRISDYLQRYWVDNDRYCDPKRITRHEYSVFSQFGEDGIIVEIFRRIGDTSRFFVEIGAGDGCENNTAYLLTRGWSGAWIEAGRRKAAKIQAVFAPQFRDRTLRFRQARVTAENIEAILSELGVEHEFDLLSVDIDYNTYWIWRAIRKYSPRVVVIEYNAAFPPPDAWMVRYDADGVWDGSIHAGASLEALRRLGEEKGYRLVGCCFAGSNAFFVRADLAGDLFRDPFTAENHYEPARYFLYTDPGHRRGWGNFERP
jgi:hypothetical protein